MQGQLGQLNDEEMQSPFKERWTQIIGCYQSAKTRGKLWYLGGTVELKFRVGADGAPKTVHIVSSNVGNWDTERCVLQIARGITFARPHGGAEAEFTYPIEFRARAQVLEWEGERVLPLLRKPKSKPLKDMAECKKQLAGVRPPPMSMTLYVAPGGKVTSAGFSADAEINDAWAGCLADKSRQWRLDDPMGRIARATVPIGE